MADEEVTQSEKLNQITEAERRCHQFATDVFIASYQRDYEETANSKYELPNEWTVGIKLIGFYFSKSMRDEAKIPQHEWRRMLLFAPILMPLFILFQLVSIVILPWDYYEKYQQKRAELEKIKAKIAEIRRLPMTEYSPRVKTLEALWKPYRNYKLNLEEVTLVLNHWIELLYGEAISKTVDIEALIDEMVTSRVKANGDFYRGKANSAHFYFETIDESLVRILSRRLPVYG